MNFVKILLPKVVFLLGISIFFYPTFSDWWNMGRQSAVISRYEKQLEVLDKEEQRQILKQAREYNESLGEGGFFVLLNEEERKNYRKSQLIVIRIIINQTEIQIQIILIKQ